MSFLLSLILTPSMVEMSRILRVVDRADEERKIHSGEVALLGGLAVSLSFAGAILLSDNSFPEKYKVLMIAASIIAFVGFIDDLINVPAKIRLLVQFFLALWVIDKGISFRLFPVGEEWGVALNEAMTLIWIIGFTNAYNFIDGLDGLASGLGIIIALFASFISLINGDPSPFLISLPLAGALLGFLVFNFNPAWIFLGDIGAQFSGFVLSAITADAAWAHPGEYFKALLLPGLVMWVLLFDMVQITVFRVKYGFVKNISEWIAFVGKDHIHHRFLIITKSQKKTAVLIWIISASFSVLALVLALLDMSQIIALSLIILGLLFSLYFMFWLDRKTSHLCFGISKEEKEKKERESKEDKEKTISISTEDKEIVPLTDELTEKTISRKSV